ncbi:hypothetical protein D210916BOD24_24310 [Alteromonas sp. D210916BOD_24]|uniref:protein tyrosine phosphatase family protein n=1 Tax=Alteromonas sp. D210916BOD_24 TaxID=3157618 RepID=UPI00399C907C
MATRLNILFLTLSFCVAATTNATPFQTFADMTLSQGGGEPANSVTVKETLSSLKNLQQNTSTMYSSGLPELRHFVALKAQGLTHVIDLLPGDRNDEEQATATLELNYLNIPVEWDAPSLANFLTYASHMETVNSENGTVLTHCKLNWRGATFTYLYRVAILGEQEADAKQDLMRIWHPNATWYAFMQQVLNHYNTLNDTQLGMSFRPAP